MVRIAVVGPSMRLGHRIWESGRRKFRIRIRIPSRTTARAGRDCTQCHDGRIKSGLDRLVRQCLFPKNSPNVLRPHGISPTLKYWRSLGDSNPCFRRERAKSARLEPGGPRFTVASHCSKAARGDGRRIVCVTAWQNCSLGQSWDVWRCRENTCNRSGRHDNCRGNCRGSTFGIS